ncbi:hypothetical protein SmJEL517_g01745 [Synchytrium microbalum]|uniref:Enoyl-CoA hydratase n=1 Tax=Synchytrium microbalum TaxID=1806994 RepID=A0A507C8H5_9FUNG|nr:uncharacterized protein SmJEL517_g01745 [Synchytrium microbalum]TPX35922.1 hypothetical protein SmJEL517_g01745 [Synchytrium microbalum]
MAQAQPDYSTLNSELIKVELKDYIGVITLNRPDIGNLWSDDVAKEVINAFQTLDGDDLCRVMVITGAGRIFCGGADFRGGKDFASRNTTYPTGEHYLLAREGNGTLALQQLRKPTIAAINGAAIGIGATFPLNLDIRITHRKNKIGFVFNRRGINLEAASSWNLPRLVGHARAMGIVLRGDIRAAEHPSLRPLWETLVEAPEDVMPAAMALAKEIAVQASVVSNIVNKALLLHPKDTAGQQSHLEGTALFYLGGSADSKEGVQSFLQKRDPKYTSVPSRDVPPFMPWWSTPDMSKGKYKL